LLDELHQYEVLRDDLFKWYNLPYWEAVAGMEQAEKAIRAQRGKYVLGPLLIATVQKVKRAESRITLRAAQVRVLEAVRLHAGETGTLPGSLAEVRLPLPVDPFTGKTFSYTLAGDAATLGTVYKLEGERLNRWYEIRLRK
jgi:hypothetical protein